VGGAGRLDVPAKGGDIANGVGHISDVGDSGGSLCHTSRPTRVMPRTRVARSRRRLCPHQRLHRVQRESRMVSSIHLAGQRALKRDSSAVTSALVRRRSGRSDRPAVKAALLGKRVGISLAHNLADRGQTCETWLRSSQYPANSPVMLSYENQVRAALEGGGSVDYSVTPIYEEAGMVPLGIALRATGDGGPGLWVTVLNRAATP
jgi:hypothetical protein